MDDFSQRKRANNGTAVREKMRGKAVHQHHFDEKGETRRRLAGFRVCTTGNERTDGMGWDGMGRVVFPRRVGPRVTRQTEGNKTRRPLTLTDGERGGACVCDVKKSRRAVCVSGTAPT